MLTEAESWGIVLGLWAIGAGLLAIGLAITVPFVVERLRRPHLVISLSPNLVPNSAI